MSNENTQQSEIRRGDPVSSVRVQYFAQYAHIRIWNRGRKAGTIIVERGDASEILRRLGGGHDWTFEPANPNPVRDALAGGDV